jgi:hypothetical protein
LTFCGVTWAMTAGVQTPAVAFFEKRGEAIVAKS